MRTARLRQLGGLGLACVLAIVSSAETITAAHTQLDGESAPFLRTPRPSEQTPLAQPPSQDPQAPEAPDNPNSSADLGPQPILLLDRVAKPAAPAHRSLCPCPLADTIGPRVRINTIPFQCAVAPDGIEVLAPTVQAGMLHQAHGPPICV